MSILGTDHHRTKYIIDSKPLVDRTFLEVHGFTEGKGAVRDRRGAYFIDIDGKPTTAERYRRTYPYTDGLAAVEDDLGMFHMDSEGKEIYSRRFGWVSEYHEGICSVRYRNGRYTFIDEEGNPWEQTYRYCSDFSEGFGIILDDEGFAYVDKVGNLAFGRHFGFCKPFSKGLAPVEENGRWHLIDPEGKTVSEDADYINEGNNGLFTGIIGQVLHYFSKDRNWVPMFRLQDKVCNDEIPAWTDDILNTEWDSCVVFMRHSERTSHFLCNAWSIGKTGLTAHGDELARAIGKKISSLNWKSVRGYCSSAGRCVTTANCIMGAMGAEAKIDISPEVGPGGTAYIYDNRLSAEDLRCPGTVWMERGMHGEIIHGWHPYEVVMKNLYDMVVRLLSDDDSLTFCVNHDLYVIPPIAFITGRFPQNEWVDYCEGCLFIKKGERISMIWDGREYPIDPDKAISIDCTPADTGITMDLGKPDTDRSWMFAPIGNTAWIGKRSGGMYTLCDKQGRFFHCRQDEFPAYNKTYDFARDFTEQCAPVYEKGRGSSFVTDFGDYLHNRWFLDCRCYREGLAAVRDEDGWKYIDADGKPVFEGRYDRAYDFNHGEALVILDGVPSRISRDGTVTGL